MKTGVYIIINIVNNKIYIGSSSYNIKYRKAVHFRLLKQNNHENSYLQRAFNKYGIENFNFEILEYCNKENCLEREQYWMDHYRSYIRKLGYNINTKSNSRLNSKHSLVTKNKIRNKAIGRKASMETKQKLSEAGKIKVYSKFAVQRMKESTSKPVLQFDLEGNFIKEWPSTVSTEKEFGKGIVQISCYRKAKSCKGYHFEYKL